MVNVFVLYPRTETSVFKEDYYRKTHGAMVAELLKPEGLRDFSINTAVAPDQPFHIIARLTFDSLDAFQQAMGKHGEALTGDIPNFFNEQPIFYVGEE